VSNVSISLPSSVLAILARRVSSDVDQSSGLPGCRAASVDMSLWKEVVDFWREPAPHVIFCAVICFLRVILCSWRGRKTSAMIVRGCASFATGVAMGLAHKFPDRDDMSFVVGG